MIEKIHNESFFSYELKDGKIEIVHYPTEIDDRSTCVFNRSNSLIVIKDPSYNELLNKFVSLGLEIKNDLIDYFE